MEIINNVVYEKVTYPKEVKDVYQKAINEHLKGYSASTNDGRYFKWVDAQNKAVETNDKVVYLNSAIEDIRDSIVEVNEKVVITSPLKEVKKEDASKNVEKAKEKIIGYKRQINALSQTISNMTIQDESKNKQLTEKDLAIKVLEDKLNKSNQRISELESDIEAILAL